MSDIRLQVFIAKTGLCSRRKAENYITSGLIKVNNKIVKELGVKINPNKDIISFKNKILKEEEKIYIALNKPENYVSSCKAIKDEKIILDLINIDKRIFPIGRLDKNSCGLLILTNDGKLHNKVSHPSFNHEKEYFIKTLNPLKNKDFEKLEKGILIDDVKTRSAKIKKINSKSFHITLKEGRKRQIRKMLEALDNKVIFLKRIRIENIYLDKLKKGQWRYLKKEEINTLKNKNYNKS